MGHTDRYLTLLAIGVWTLAIATAIGVHTLAILLVIGISLPIGIVLWLHAFGPDR